jgi:hypothetical protein
MDKTMSERCDITCNVCGIGFSFSNEVEKLWRDSHKTFYCPNGHGLSWEGETPTQKELREKRALVLKLEKELSALKQFSETLTIKMQEMEAELEIWKPTSAKEPAA